jgi:hypothetical protein
MIIMAKAKKKAEETPAETTETKKDKAYLDGKVTPVHQGHADYIENLYGVKVDPAIIFAVYSTRVAYRKTSDQYGEAKAARVAAKEAAAAAKEEAKAKKAAEREAKAAEKKAAKEKAAAEEKKSSKKKGKQTSAEAAAEADAAEEAASKPAAKKAAKKSTKKPF